MKEKDRSLGIFEKYLTLWVALCILLGVMIGQWIPVFLRQCLNSKSVESRFQLPYSFG